MKAQRKWFYSLSLRERVGVRDSGCPAVAGVPPPSVARHRRGVRPKGGGTKQNLPSQTYRYKYTSRTKIRSTPPLDLCYDKQKKTKGNDAMWRMILLLLTVAATVLSLNGPPAHASGSSATPFIIAKPNYRWQFPQDHGEHPDYAIEPRVSPRHSCRHSHRCATPHPRAGRVRFRR